MWRVLLEKKKGVDAFAELLRALTRMGNPKHSPPLALCQLKIPYSLPSY